MKRLTATAAVLMLVLAACAQDDGDPAGAAATGPSRDASFTGTTGITSPTGTTGPTGPTAQTGTGGSIGPTAVLDPELEDGEHFGFVESVDATGGTMVFDLAYFLTGQEANEAAAERGLETPVPNDYFIVNDNPRLRTLVLAPDVELALLDWDTCCDEFIEGDLAIFAEAIDADGLVTIDGQLYYGSLSPYWLTVEGGFVTRIEEQYLP